MRAGDPRRWRLGGWRRRGKQRAGWWKGSDGHWYPPEAARHPAARAEPAAPRRPPPRRLAFAAPLGLVAVLLVALVLAGLTGGLADPALTDRVETFGAGAGPGDPLATHVVAASLSASIDSEAIAAVAVAVPAPAGAPTTPTGDEPAVPSSDGYADDPVPPGESGEPGPQGNAEHADDGGGDSPDDPPPGDDPSPTAPPATDEPPTSAPPPGPATPGDADDCRHSGWQHLVDDEGRPFANQGQCVNYVSGR